MLGATEEATKEVEKFTKRQIDDYVTFATKQGDKKKVMLGKFEGKDNPLSYQKRAGSDYWYFDMGNKWDEALLWISSKTMWREKIRHRF